MKYLALLGTLTLGACSTLGATPQAMAPPVSDYCQIAKPVQVSKKDTRVTKEQADREWRKYQAVCLTR